MPLAFMKFAISVLLVNVITPDEPTLIDTDLLKSLLNEGVPLGLEVYVF